MIIKWWKRFAKHWRPLQRFRHERTNWQYARAGKVHRLNSQGTEKSQPKLTSLDVRSKCKTRFLLRHFLASRRDFLARNDVRYSSRIASFYASTRVLERNTGGRGRYARSVRCIPSSQRECNTSLIAILGPRLSTSTVH